MTDKLYDIADSIRSLIDMIEDTEAPEFDSSVGDALSDMKCSFDKKAEQILLFAREQMYRADARFSEATRLQEEGRRCVNLARRLRTYVKTQMETAGIDECQGDIIRMKIYKNGGKLPILTIPWDGEVPDRLMKVEKKMDQDKLRAELEAGAIFPFAQLADRGTHLRDK